ncbi:MAG: dihydrodipicolinate synthase family protein [Bacteroidales bacterium]
MPFSMQYFWQRTDKKTLTNWKGRLFIMNKYYHGVIPPIITPIDKNENVDENGFRTLLNHCVEHGLHGIFVAGSNGETMALTQEQRDNAIRIAISEVGSKVPVMCGVMDTSTRRVIENIKRLEAMGGTCAVITSIFYARHTSQDETIRLFEEVSRNTQCDLMVYNIPMFTNMKLTADTILRIAKIDKVVGVKDSSGDFGEFQKILRVYADNQNFSCLQGSTAISAAAILEGADGYVPSIAPLFPELFVQMYEYAKEKNILKTLELDAIIAETQKILGMSKNATASNKYALSLLGFTDKKVIAPQDCIALEEEKNILRKVEEIRNLLKIKGIIQ